MRKLALCIAAPVAVSVLTACGASAGEIRDAKNDAAERGFTVLSAESIDTADVYIDVSFGEKGCAGTLKYSDGKPKLNIDVPIPGAQDETTYLTVANPRVDTLRTVSAFNHCFEVK